MKVQELRYGNWVALGPLRFKVEAISSDLIHVDNKGVHAPLHIEKAEPIPLTEQVLLDCGFKQEAENYWSIEHFKISFQQGNFWYLFENYSVDFNIPDIEITSLHQLQNLYFALTGEELQYQHRPI